MTWGPRRRFWRAAAIAPADGGFAVLLDARPLRTPAGAALVVPTERLAAAIAAEWDALGAEILPDRLPLTRAANSSIDRVAAAPGPVVATLAAYGGDDLLCYRAAQPEALAARQAAAWDPWLCWSADALRAPLVAVAGVMHHPQPERSLAALAAEVAGFEPFALSALQELVTLSGSLVLALAVAKGALGAEEGWRLSRLDEDWQAEQWGLDAEAGAAVEARRTAFLHAAALLALLAPPTA